MILEAADAEYIFVRSRLSHRVYLSWAYYDEFGSSGDSVEDGAACRSVGSDLFVWK